MTSPIRRRLLMSTAALLLRPFAAFSQSAVRVPRVGLLIGGTTRLHLTAFLEAIGKDGWINGSNIEIVYRWGQGKIPVMRTQAEALVNLKPDVIAVSTASALREVKRIAGNTPIVFYVVSDPVGNKFVENLARPEGNVTGFSLFEYDMGGKWLQLLREATPGLKRVLVLMNSVNPNLTGWLKAMEPVARATGLQLFRPELTNASQIEGAIVRFAHEHNGGVLVLPDPFTSASASWDVIVRTANKYRLPTVSGSLSRQGGLLAYGPDQGDLARRAAIYVSRILKGEKPSALPVQAPTKFQFIVDLKTAESIGLRIPQTILIKADEVIQ